MGNGVDFYFKMILAIPDVIEGFAKAVQINIPEARWENIPSGREEVSEDTFAKVDY